MLWPAGRTDVIGWMPYRFQGNLGLMSGIPAAGSRFNPDTGETWSGLSALPVGYYAGGSYALPVVAGALSSNAQGQAVLSGSGNLAEGRNISGAAAMEMAGTANGSAIAAAVGAATMSMSGSATLTGVASLAGTSAMSLVGAAVLGGRASITGAGSMVMTGSAQTNALGFMTGGPISGALTADQVAEAVWARLGINGQTYGATMTSAEKWAKLAAALSA